MNNTTNTTIKEVPVTLEWKDLEMNVYVNTGDILIDSIPWRMDKNEGCRWVFVQKKIPSKLQGIEMELSWFIYGNNITAA